MPTRTTAARLAAATCTATLALGLAATTASADQTAPVPDATLIDGEDNGLPVNVDEMVGVNAHLFTLQLANGPTFNTYCVELRTDVDSHHPDMIEVPWDSYPDPSSPFHLNRAHVNWILHNSYPGVDVESLSTAVGTEFTDGLSTDEAIAATQAAIWHFTDDAALADDEVKDTDEETPVDTGTDNDVRAVYDYLIGGANVGISEQPVPELALEPASGSGTAGEAIGPLTVSTTAESAALTAELPDGVTLVDAAGNEVADAVANGAELFVDVPRDAEAGNATIQLSASAELSIGRLWIGAENKEFPTQSMILATSEATSVDVTGTVEWEAAPEEETPAPPPTQTPAPEESLPDTGSSSMTWPLIAGIFLVAGGIGAVALRRRSQ